MGSTAGTGPGTFRTFVVRDFDDPRLGRDRWNGLLARGDTDVVFLTWEFQRAWRDAYGWGEPLVVVAERNGEVVALAPFVTDHRSICFGGEGQGDWLDFIGDVSDDSMVTALIQAARAAAPASAEFDLQAIPGWQPRLRQLEEAAARLGFAKTFTVTKPITPLLEVAALPNEAAAMAARKAAREDRWFRRQGELVVEQFRDGDEILPHLDSFFDQHVARWAGVEHGYSVFSETSARMLVKQLTRLMAKTGWLRFFRLLWNGRPIAYDYNFSYGNRFYMWRGTFAKDFAARSPGAVMVRHVVLAALEEGVDVIDWGPGRTPYKLELANRIENAHWWGVSR
jgi:CelD/BcsL family acetyltransferase involved in cellulose biosynthesis